MPKLSVKIDGKKFMWDKGDYSTEAQAKERMDKCSAYIDRRKPCWELNTTICKSKSGKICNDCVVFLSKSIKKKAT